MGSWILPMLSAAKNKATSGTPRWLIIDQHRDHQTQIAVSARDGRDQAVVDAGHLHGPATPASAPHNKKANIMYCQVGMPSRKAAR